jgi:hypothetical protein
METEGQDVTLTYNSLVLDTILKMRDSQAAGNLEKYTIYFEYALQLLLPHFHIDVRKEIQADHDILKQAIRDINQKESNDQSKKNKVLAARESFANSHRYYVMMALTKVGIVKVSEEGVIDFSSIDIETMKGIIRSSGQGVMKAVDEKVK